MRLFAFWEQVRQDVRYALRVMAGQPLFTAMATLSLALGIGANTAIYSFMDAILLRALPVQHPESLVVLHWHAKTRPPVVRSMNGSTVQDPKLGYTAGSFPYRGYEHLRADSPQFSSLFAFFGAGQLNLQIHGQAELAGGEYVSGEYFGGLGVPPAAGRLIEGPDDRAGAPPVAVLSFRFAQRRFGDVTAAPGQSILINNVPFTVAGVAGPEFFGLDPAEPPDVYLPLHSNLLVQPLPPGHDPNWLYVDNSLYWVQMMGRLRPGVTRDQAQTALAATFQHFVEATAATAREHTNLPSLYLQDGAGGLDLLRREFSKPLYVLMTMVALILAIACANIANLLLARATARRREMALRLSLGAGRLRVVRQLLTESVLLASLGGVLGVVVASSGVRALTLLIGNGREDFTLHATMNWRVLAVTLALSVTTGMLFGLAPAIQSVMVDLNGALRQARGGEHRLHLASWLRIAPSHALVVSQIAVSLLLLAAAGLFLRTLNNLNSVALGFNGERVLLFTVNAQQAGYKKEALVRFYEDLQARLSMIPGVRTVSSSEKALVSGSQNTTNVKLAGFTGKNPGTSFLSVGPGFFSTMQIPILLGREVDERDIRQGATVAVVNEVFAKTYFEGQNPIGRRFSLGAHGLGEVEIIGVSRNARYRSLKEDIPPVTYLPYSQNLISLGPMTYELRSAGNAFALAQSVRQVVQQEDARVPAFHIGTQAERIGQTIGQERTFATLCSCFASLAMLIACVGLYATMAYSVARRSSEMGIRMALGAQRGRLVWMILREVLTLAAAGLGLGLAATVATSHVLESLMFQVKPNDPMALAVAALTLFAAALLAGYGPARRASRVDPWTSLRDE